MHIPQSNKKPFEQFHRPQLGVLWTLSNNIYDFMSFVKQDYVKDLDRPWHCDWKHINFTCQRNRTSY